MLFEEYDLKDIVDGVSQIMQRISRKCQRILTQHQQSVSINVVPPDGWMICGYYPQNTETNPLSSA